MRYVLVSTASTLLLVDLEMRAVVPVEGHRTEYYGISWFPGESDLILSHSGLDNQSLVGIASYAQSEKGWISSGERASEVFLSQPHQILCLTDGRIACTNTGRNAITIVELDKPGQFQEVRISAPRWDRLTIDNAPGDHLNSVFEKDGHLYVLGHRFTKGSQLATLSLRDGKILDLLSVAQVTGLHNIWITEDGQKVSCHSETGSLIDIENNRVLWEAGAPIYTRGLAASASHVLVGESVKTTRASRKHSMSGLWVLDRSTWQASDYICLGPYGAVHDVRLLDVPDEAHHGYVFEGLERLLMRDMRREIEVQRIDQFKRALANRGLRDSLVITFGSPEFLKSGSLRADAESLCLALVRDKSKSTFEYEYVLPHDNVGSHVSAVVGYRGAGGDTHMAALLLQSVTERAMLTLWKQDGSTWTMLPRPAISGLPLAARMKVTSTAEQISLFMNDREIISATARELGTERCNEGLGVRWIGADIKMDV